MGYANRASSFGNVREHFFRMKEAKYPELEKRKKETKKCLRKNKLTKVSKLCGQLAPSSSQIC